MSCKAFFLRIVSFILFIIALAAAAGIVYGYIFLKDFFSLSGTQGTITFAVFITVFALLFLTSIFGLYGSCKKDECGLKSFIVLSIFWVLLYVGGATFIYLTIPEFTNGNCLHNPIFNKFQSFYETTLNTNNAICQKNCQCYFSQINNPSIYSDQQQTILMQKASNYSKTNTTLPVLTQACPNWVDGSILYQGSLLFQFMEDKFKCTGWCSNTSSLYYKFTNVNRGIPEDNCYNRISSYFSVYGVLGYAVLYGLGGILLITAIAAYLYLKQIRQQMDDEKGDKYDKNNRNAPNSQRNQLYQ